jgi:hypothetical protein
VALDGGCQAAPFAVASQQSLLAKAAALMKAALTAPL